MSLTVGTIVKLTERLLGNDAGTFGVVYENYNIGGNHPGCSIIFANGDYDGFGLDEQERFLENTSKVDPKVASYEFSNVMQLSKDFSDGYFDHVLEVADEAGT